MPFFEGLARKFKKEEEASPVPEMNESHVAVDYGSAERRYKGQDYSIATSQAIAVADGVSSIPGGEVASRLAAMEMLSLPDLSQATEEIAVGAMSNIFDKANNAILKQYAHFLAIGEYDRVPSTTLSAMAFFDHNRRAVLGNIGDSSVCRVRNGKIERLTPEDTLLSLFEDNGITVNYNEKDRASLNMPMTSAIDRGSLRTAEKNLNKGQRDRIEKAIRDFIRRGTTVAEARNNLTFAMGMESPEYHILTTDVEPGDVFLAFSDGLDKKLTFEEIGEVVKNNPTKSAKELATILVSMGYEKDDVSVAVLMAEEEVDLNVAEEQTAKNTESNK